MESSQTMIVVLLLSPGIMLAVHTTGARLCSGRSPQLVALLSVAAAAAPLAAVLWVVSFRHLPGRSPTAVDIVYSVICYGALGYTYFHFFNMSETARRIRILREIHRAGVLSAEDMEGLYKTTDIISIRLGRLTALGQLTCREGSYEVRGRTLYWSGRAVLFWRKLLGLREDGA